MTNLLVETVLVAFCVGGAFGAVVTLHLQYYHRSREQAKRESKAVPVLQNAEARVNTRRFHK